MKPPDEYTTRRQRWLLIAVCAAAFAIRLPGISYGLPDVYNPDEVAIMNRALAFATGDLNPKNFLYPSFYFYVLFAWEALFFVVGRVTGVFASLADFERTFFTDPTWLFLAGRMLSVVAGVATVWAVGKFGAKLYGTATGLIAATFLAASPIAVRDAHYVKHDVPVTLLIVLVHVLIARLVVDSEYRARQRSWILAGLVAGVAVSTHYYAVFVLVPLAVAAFVRAEDEIASDPSDRPQRLRRLATAAIAAGVAFFAASPFILVEPSTVYRDVVANREIVMDRAVDTAGVFPSLLRYVRLLATDALGLPVFLAGLIGFVIALFNWRRGLLLVAFPLPFLLFISNTVPASRYLNPVLPSLAVAAALAVATFTRGQAASSTIFRVLRMALPVLLALPALRDSLATGMFFRQADTRSQARAFIEQQVPAGSSVLVQPYSVALRQSREGLVEALRLHLGSESRASTKFQKQLALQPYPAPAYRTIFLGDGGLDKDKIYVSPSSLTGSSPLAPLRALALDYVVLKRYNADSSLDPLIAALNQEGRLLAAFTPYAAGDLAAAESVEPFLHNTDAQIHPRLERPGPMIEVWKIDR